MLSKYWVLLSLLLPLVGCSSEGISFSTTSNKLVAVGYAPISLQQPEDQQQKLLYAMRASRMDAYRELTEQLGGVMTTSSSQMHSSILKDGTVNNSSRGVVRGARVVNSYPDGDLYITELELDLRVYEKLRRGH